MGSLSRISLKGLVWMHYSLHIMSKQGDQALLSALGARIRRIREGIGLTVTALAEQAGVSRRYVTEAEAGRANLTVLKLAAMAGALRVPLSELCDLPVAAPRTERIALVGLRGAGKSTVGALLARALETPFVELDERVERLAGLSLSAIFDLQGVETYRRLEREALEEVLAEGQRQVIATGGSIVTSPESFGRLREACRTVWLQAAPEVHLERVLSQGDRRPVEGHPRALDELREILARRKDLYAQADEHIPTDQSEPAAVVEELLGRFGS